MRSRESIQQEVYEMIRDVLCVEAGEIRPDARFEKDLGGESIDVLELSFHCEKRFGVKISFHNAFPADKLHIDDEGKLTAGSIAYIKSQFPYLDLGEFEKNPHIGRILELLTVQVITDIVVSTVQEADMQNTSQGTATPSPQAV